MQLRMKHELPSFAFSKREIRSLRVIIDNQNVSIRDISSQLGNEKDPYLRQLKILKKKGSLKSREQV